MAGNQDCDLLPVVGTVVVAGPVELDVDDTIYSYVVIEEKDGTMRDFETVHAVPGLSELIERHTFGLFLFWDGPAELRLFFVQRLDDPHPQVDIASVRAHLKRHIPPR